MKHLPYLLWMLLLVACSSIDCPVDNVVQTQYKVVRYDDSDFALPDSLSVTSTKGNGRDTLLLNKLIAASKFTLPISYSHPEDVLVFHFDFESDDPLIASVHEVDTVWVKKDDHPHFESVDCNATFFHTLTGVRCTHNYIDTIVIKDPSVTFNDETIHFYLYPKSDD